MGRVFLRFAHYVITGSLALVFLASRGLAARFSASCPRDGERVTLSKCKNCGVRDSFVIGVRSRGVSGFLKCARCAAPVLFVTHFCGATIDADFFQEEGGGGDPRPRAGRGQVICPACGHVFKP